MNSEQISIPMRATPPTRRRRQALTTVLFAFLPAVALPLGWYVSTRELSEVTAAAIFAAVVVLVIGWLAWLFALPKPRPIVLDDEVLEVSFGRRRMHLHLDELFSARVVKGDLVLVAAVADDVEPRGDLGVIVVPKRCFTSAIGADAVLALLREQIKRRHDGGARVGHIDGVTEAQKRFAAKRPVVIWLVAAVCCAIFAAQASSTAMFNTLVLSGANIASAVVDGEVWRLVTANLLHGSLIHLAMNMVSMLSVGAVIERWLGRWSIALALVVTGVGGQLASTLVGLLKTTPHASVGISGAIFGLMGVLLVSSVRFRRSSIGGVRVPLEGWAILVVANLAISLIPVVDVVAHAGGAVAGVLVGLLVVPRPRASNKRPLRTIRAAAIVALVVLTAAVVRWAVVLAALSS